MLLRQRRLLLIPLRRTAGASRLALEEHSIKWIVLETAEGFQRKTLKPGDKPEAVFALTEGDNAVAAYAYCDLHGLWSANE